VPEEHIRNHPVPVAGVMAALGATALGLVLSFVLLMVIWLLAAHGNESTFQVAQSSGIAWLASQLVPVTIGDATLGLLPWGFIVIPVVFLWKSTHWAMKSALPEAPRDFWFVAAATSVAYAVMATLVGLAASSAGLGVHVVGTFVHTIVLALVVTGGVVIRYAPSADVVLDQLPDYVGKSIRPAVRMAFVLYLVGALLVAVSLVLHWPEMTSVQHLMAPGGTDGIFLWLLSIGYLPTAAMWSTSYILGPGIHLGGGAVISLTSATSGALPAFPLLSIVPTAVPVHPMIFLVIPIAIGAVLFLLLPRGHWQAHGTGLLRPFLGLVRIQDVVILVVALSVLGTMVFIGAAMSSGSLGVNLLKFVGPDPLVTAKAAVTLCGIGAVGMMFIPRLILVFLFVASGRHKDDDALVAQD